MTVGRNFFIRAGLTAFPGAKQSSISIIMKRFIKNSIFVLTAFAAACNDIGGSLSDTPVMVSLSASVHLEELTKASPLTSVPDFAMYGYTWSGASVGNANYCAGEKMVKTGTSYVSASKYPKVGAGENLLLMGIAPYGEGGWSGPAADAAGTPKFTYSMPSDVADQKDVVVGLYSTDEGFEGTCDMTFSHVLSGVRFALADGGGFDGKIVSIALKGIHTKGTYTLGSGWSGQGTPGATSLALDKDVTVASTGLFTTDPQTFVLLPQTCGADAQMEIVADDGSGNVTLTASLSGKAFEEGKMYTFNLDLSSLAGHELFIESIDLSSWEYDPNQYGVSKVMSYTGPVSAGTFALPEMTLTEGTSLIIDWGDGSDVERCGAAGVMNFSHRYASSGSKTVSMYARGGTISLVVGYPKGEGPYTVYNENIVKAKYFFDLSKYDFMEKRFVDLSSQETANCYVVRATGKDYRFPLVYGNGIKGGADNPDAYRYRSDLTNGGAFVDHNGLRINSPYILVQSGLNESLVTAELLWTTKTGMVSNVSIKDGYVSFDVNSLGGNASIVLKNGSTVLWSWHIWATDYELSAPEGMLNYDLGTEGSGTKYYCFYQWGRKDPFPENKTSAWTKTSQYITNMSATIRNPSVMIYDVNEGWLVSDYHHYCQTEYRNNWCATADKYNVNFTTVVKTIYDPCPPGFHVPQYSWFKDGAYSNSKYTVKGLEIPQGKHWSEYDEAFKSTVGIRWLADAYDALCGGACGFYNSSYDKRYVAADYFERGNGGLVRPVRSE